MPNPIETITASASEMEGVSGKGFIALSVRDAWEVGRIQSALMDLFGYSEDFYWQDPSTLHITLAYSDDISDDQLAEAVKAVIGQNALTLKLTGIGTFVNGDTQAIYLSVEDNADLRALQQAITDSLTAQGVVVSPLSDPASWVPHMTLLTAPATTTVPNPELNIEVWCADEVTFSRDQYQEVLSVNLIWPVGYTRPDIEGIGPVDEMAREQVHETKNAKASWKAGAASGLPIMSGDPAWDGAAAAKSVFDAAGFGTNKVDTALARKAFLVYNASAPELKGSYKLGIAQMADGKLTVVPAGLRQAASRLRQVKGVPASVLDSAETVLNAYEKKAGIGEMANAQGVVAEQSDKPPTIRLTMISEMRGSYPDIPLPEGVNLAEIERITGQKPFFVTLPIGRFNSESNNGRTYLRTAVEDMVNEINASRPYGGWGHITEQEMSTRFDPPAVQWMAALIDDQGVAWGKALPQNQETRHYYELAKATGSRVATSLVGLAEMNQNQVVHLALKRVDIADPARIGIPDTIAAPKLTSEMVRGAAAQTPNAGDVFVQPSTPATSAARKPAAAGAEGTRVPNSPDSTKGKNSMDEKEIQELQSNHDQLQTTVSEQVGTIEAQKKALAEMEVREKAHLAELGVLLAEFVSTSVTKDVAVENVRPLVTELVIALQPQTRDEVTAKLAQVLDRPSVQALLKGAVSEMMGDKQAEPHKTPSGGAIGASRWLEDEPKTEQRIRLPSFEGAAD